MQRQKAKEGTCGIAIWRQIKACILSSLQEQEFTAKQAQSMDQELKRILDEQKEERKLLELRFLDAQQDLKRSKFIYLASDWIDGPWKLYIDQVTLA